VHGGPGGYRGAGLGGMGLTAPPPGIKWIMIASLAVWILQQFLGRSFPYDELSVSSYAFRVWQPVTYMWLHDPGSLLHIVSNMLPLYFLGASVERLWGTRRFVQFYFIAGIGAGVFIAGWDQLDALMFEPSAHITLGASGAVFGVLTAFCLIWPDRTLVLLFPPIPFKAMYLIPGLFVLQLLADAGGGMRISHTGHLGGVIMALIYLRKDFAGGLSGISWSGLRYRWNRYRMKSRLRAARRDHLDRNRNRDRSTYH
jgi:membrane associated rhomboid family serine protease